MKHCEPFLNNSAIFNQGGIYKDDSTVVHRSTIIIYADFNILNFNSWANWLTNLTVTGPK
jgi:hypothetical protein